MESFSYASPATLAEALKILAAGDAQVLAGGTDLISLMKDYVVSPKTVVNIKNIKELGGVGPARSGGLRIGATVSLDDLAANPALRTSYPSLRTAILGIASPQIRNMGTAGGDLCQRPRCWYFRNGFGLLAMKDGKSLITGGENKYHAILGGGPAYFVSPSSLGPALIALNASFTAVSSKGKRSIDAAKFFVSPKDENAREIDLNPDEILSEIVIPAAHGVKNATYEIREREAVDWPVAAASVALTMSGTKVSKAAVVLGHVAPTPWVASKAAEYLAGKSIDDSTAEEAGKLAVDGAQPLSQNSYKIQLAKVSVKRALLQAAGRA